MSSWETCERSLMQAQDPEDPWLIRVGLGKGNSCSFWFCFYFCFWPYGVFLAASGFLWLCAWGSAMKPRLWSAQHFGALAPRLWPPGSAAPQLLGSQIPIQGSNLHPLLQKVDSEPLDHQRSPNLYYFNKHLLTPVLCPTPNNPMELVICWRRSQGKKKRRETKPNCRHWPFSWEFLLGHYLWTAEHVRPSFPPESCGSWHSLA